MGIDTEMLVRTKSAVNIAELSKRAWDAFPNFFYFSHWKGKSKGALSLEDVHHQDGPTIVAEKGESFVVVNTLCRYYGKGYERGPAHEIILLADWLERNIPGGQVLYGGDSSGVLCEPFGSERRAELWLHFCEFGHSPYHSYFTSAMGKYGTCPFCGCAMNQTGFGGSYGRWQCGSCGAGITKRGENPESVEMPLSFRQEGDDFAPPKNASNQIPLATICSEGEEISAEVFRELQWRLGDCFGGGRLYSTSPFEPNIRNIDGSGKKLRVQACTQSYAVNNEIGDLPLLCALGAWFHQCLPGRKVTLDGRTFGMEDIKDIWSYYCKHGHLTPRQGRWVLDDLCPTCKTELWEKFAEPGRFHCLSCGRVNVYRADGELNTLLSLRENGHPYEAVQ